MKTRLSGLVDGELEARDAEVVLEAVKHDAELRERWRHYQLIGDALKGGGALHRDITVRVMAALEDEPVVLAPRRSRPREWSRTVLALAASVAGVALVSWVALGPRNEEGRPAAEFAAASAPVQVSAQTTPAQPAAGDMQEYLVAHQAQAGSLRFRGGTENIRTVAAGGGAFAR